MQRSNLLKRVTNNTQTAKKGNKKMKENKLNYLDAEELYDEYKKSVEAGQCTERLGEMFLTLTDHMLRSPNFNRYPKELKEDLRGHALEKLMKSLKTVKLEFTPHQIFNFATRTVYTAFLSELGRHYKFDNLKRKVTKEYLMKSDFISPQIRDQMIRDIDDFDKEVELKKKATKERKIKKAAK